jgi:nucleoside-diphosphate-sugar epimerase
MTKDDTILVLGGTGKTGRRIVDRLQAADVPVRVGSRAAEPPFDWDDRSSWSAALDGVRAVYISYYPDLAVPGARDAIEAFTEHALEQGVRRLLLLRSAGGRRGVHAVPVRRGPRRAQRARDRRRPAGARPRAARLRRLRPRRRRELRGSAHAPVS